jgi:hypothetical protein
VIRWVICGVAEPISWVDFLSRASTCAVMYFQQHTLLYIQYIMVVKVGNTICPFHRSLYFTGGLRCRPILKEYSLYIAGRNRKAVPVYNVRYLCFFFQLNDFQTNTWMSQVVGSSKCIKYWSWGDETINAQHFDSMHDLCMSGKIRLLPVFLEVWLY